MINDADAYVHIRIVLGIIQGLSMAILLNGLARFIQQPNLHRVFLPHLLWAIAMLLSLLHFWWEEMALGKLHWTLPLYLFALVYAMNFYLMCAVLFPPNLDTYSNYRDYFLSRRRWFFGQGMLAQLLVVADILFKGPYHAAIDEPGERLAVAGAFLAIYGYLSWSRNTRVHVIAAVLSLTMILLVFLDDL